MNSEYVVQLDGQVDAAPDPQLIGVKAARLAELAREGIRVPAGFAVTATAYREFVRDARLGPAVAQAIRRFRAGRDLVVVAAEIRSAFRDASLPSTVVDDILKAYQELGGDGTEVAVRCSPVTAPDAVLDDVFLHLSTGSDVVAACRRCFASLYSTVAVGNREAEGVDQLAVVMPVTVQRMVRSDLGGSGTPEERAGLVLTDDDLQELAGWSALADKHFRRPTTLDWAKDGCSGELYLVEVRPGVPLSVTIQVRGGSLLEPQYR